MESVSIGVCSLIYISWVWLTVAIIIGYGVGVLWYGVIFAKVWRRTVRYECTCGSNLSNGAKCYCGRRDTAFDYAIQVLSISLVVFMYFVLSCISIWLSLLIFSTISLWMTTALKFQLSNWKRFFILTSINIGYFTIVSLVSILFALI